MGNVTADESGVITQILSRDLLDLGYEPFTSILGRAVAIHALADDGHSQPSGAAGARIFVGVIGFSEQNVMANIDAQFPTFPIVPPHLSSVDYSGNKKSTVSGAPCG